MASLAQIEANRRNSQKSTGPRTETGKIASSRNAVKTGFYAKSLLIDGEDPADLEALALDYADSCRPEGPREIALVNELLHADWLLRRMRAVESQLWNSQIAWKRDRDGEDFDESLALVYAYYDLDHRLALIQHRISALERSYHRALTDLRRLQSTRPADGEAVLVPSFQPPIANPRREAPIGFVPSQPPPTPAPAPNARFSPTLGHLPQSQPLQNPAGRRKTQQNQPRTPSGISRSFGTIRA